MKFDNLEDRMLYYRGLTDYKLIPNSYVIIMLDGRSFSKSIKKYFKKPFDDKFIHIMNEVTLYLCNNIQGCKFGYVQSDEISLVLTDFDTPGSDSFFKYRLEKICSICASLATSKFNQLMFIEEIYRNEALHKIKIYEQFSKEDVINIINNMKLYEFDCKAWNVSSYNDVFAWLLYRQNDCIRNSKQQAASTYLSYNECVKLNVDEQIDLLYNKYNIDWNKYDDGKKYGRFIYKEEVTMKSEQYGEFKRTKFNIHNAWVLNLEKGKEMFNFLSKIPQK